MSDIDWSEAPDGATHFEVGSENPWEKHGSAAVLPYTTQVTGRCNHERMDKR